MKNCLKCNLTFDDDKKFCNSCGSALTLITNSESLVELSKTGKRCLRCNLNYDEDKKFCKNCGSPLSIIIKTVSKVDAKKFVFEEKLKENRLDIKLLSEYAQFLFDSKEFKESTYILFRILAIVENNNFAENLLLSSYTELEQYDDAIEIGEVLLRNNARDLSLLEKLVFLADKLNHIGKVYDYSNKIIEIEPNNVFGLTNKVIYLLTKNKIKEAIPICYKLVELGQTSPLYLIYIGIDYVLQRKFDIAIQNFENGYIESSKKNKVIEKPKGLVNINQRDIHSNRSKLYYTYCLCMINDDLSKIKRKFNTIDFKELKEHNFESDEDIAIKTVTYIINQEINELTYDNRHLTNDITKIYLETLEFYFTDTSKQLFAECWYNIGIKQNELGLIDFSLISIQNAINNMPSERKYTDKVIEIQESINKNNTKLKRKHVIATVSISLVLLIGVLSIFLTLKHIENNTWSNLKALNTIASFKDYLVKYPKGLYENEAKERVDEILWTKALQNNTYEGYKLYADSTYNRKYAQQADSLEQSVLWHNGVVANTYEAYQRYIELFPNGRYSDKVNKIIDEKLWQKSKSQGTEADYKLYLKRFPEGKYAQKANVILDENLWNSTESQNTQSAFENYKSNFPNGMHIADANSRIDYYQSIEKRKSDLSWLIGTWSVQTNYGYTSLKIYDSSNAYTDGDSGTYSVEGNVLTVHTSGGLGITYTIDYESMTLGLGGGYVMRK